LTDAALAGWRQWRFLLLTLVLGAWMFVAPHVTERWLTQLLMQLFLIQFVVVTLWANPRWGRMGRVLIGCWLLSLVGALVELTPFAPGDGRIALALQSLASVPLLVLLAAGILRYVFAHRQLDTDGIFATIAVYLLLAFGFARAYVAMMAWSPDSFHLTAEASALGPQGVEAQLVYYSLVTLATVGYGDILPVSEAARTLAVIEATVGQFYVAVIVAVFVGMYASERRNAA
jgi:hypothetical protein